MGDWMMLFPIEINRMSTADENRKWDEINRRIDARREVSHRRVARRHKVEGVVAGLVINALWVWAIFH